MCACQWAWQCFHDYNGVCRWRLTCQSCKLDSGTRRGIGCSIMNPNRKRKSKRPCTRKWCQFSVSWSETPHQENLVSCSSLTSLFIFSSSFLHPSLSPFLSPLLSPFPPFLYLPFSLPSPLPTSLPPLLPLFSRKELGSLRLKVQCHEERVLDSQLYTKFVGIMLKTVEGEPSVRLNKQPLTPYSASLSLMLAQITLPQF